MLEVNKAWWAQRANFNWLKYGDANKKIFQAYVRYRQRQNGIHLLHLLEGGIILVLFILGNLSLTISRHVIQWISNTNLKN